MIDVNQIRRDPPVTSAVVPEYTELYGLEIEIENYGGWNLEEVMSPFSVVPDGSLRNGGAEFVSIPLGYEDSQNAIRSWYRWWRQHGWVANSRTGIHVHANMCGLSLTEVAAVVATYCAVEPFLFDLCGTEREENIYCVPWYRARDDAETLSEALRVAEAPLTSDYTSEYRLHDVRDTLYRACKYSALYLEPLNRFGTIEFRAAPTYDRTAGFLRWLAAIKGVVDLGRTLGTPEEVYNAVWAHPAEFARTAVPQAPFYTDPELVMDEYDVLGVLDKFIRIRPEPAQPWHMYLEDEPVNAGTYYDVAHWAPHREQQRGPAIRAMDEYPDDEAFIDEEDE